MRFWIDSIAGIMVEALKFSQQICCTILMAPEHYVMPVKHQLSDRCQLLLSTTAVYSVALRACS